MEKGRCYWLDDCGYCIREYNEAQTKFLCTKRPSVCEDYIENYIGEPVYKRGDDVWYFDNGGFPTICHCSIAGVSIRKGTFPLYYVFEKSGRRIGYLPGHSLFESREALCEHYRKIFE